MQTSLATALPAAGWRELLELARQSSGDRLLVERLLALWCGQWGAGAAAVYVERDGRLRLEAACGGRFPERLDEPPEEPLCVVDLGGGSLAWVPGPAGGPAAAEIGQGDPFTLLLLLGLVDRDLRSRLKEHRFQVNYRGVVLEALYDVGLAIASTLDLTQLSEEILLRAVSLLDARRGALYLWEADRFRLHSTFGGDARESFVAASDAGPDRKLRVPEDLLPGARHLLALPIEIDRDPRGVLVVADKESRRGVGPFPAADRRTLALFANQAAIALENARLHRQELEKQRLDREMELAAEIQRQILPAHSPRVAGYDLAAWSRPARQVGGDYYDLLPLADGRLRLTVGDVSGKGVPAALLVSTLHSALRLLVGEDELSAGHLERLNRHVVESSAQNKFITLFVAELSPSAGRLRFVNAGHNPGIVLRVGGSLERLEAGGVPVGLLPDVHHQAREIELAAGDLLCLYTDGIVEATDPDERELGEEGLLEILEEHRDRPLGEIIAAVDQAVASFVRGAPQADDETLVLLRRHPALG